MCAQLSLGELRGIQRHFSFFGEGLPSAGHHLRLNDKKGKQLIVNSWIRTHIFSVASALVFGVLALVVAGCGRNDVQVYRVSKEEPKPIAREQAGAMPPGHPDTGESAPPGLKYTLPPSWQETSPGQMRVASFRVNGKDGKQADVGVVPLPGLMGRDLENVNRWRSSL